jgi:predicted component of type VI protein secretion system
MTSCVWFTITDCDAVDVLSMGETTVSDLVCEDRCRLTGTQSWMLAALFNFRMNETELWHSHLQPFIYHDAVDILWVRSELERERGIELRMLRAHVQSDINSILNAHSLVQYSEQMKASYGVLLWTHIPQHSWSPIGKVGVRERGIELRMLAHVQSDLNRILNAHSLVQYSEEMKASYGLFPLEPYMVMPQLKYYWQDQS